MENILDIKRTLIHSPDIGFQDYPKELHNNIFFILEYFTHINRPSKDFKYIPQELLKDSFFISACLVKNPDIYLLADASIHSTSLLELIKKNSPHSYLKYAPEKDLNDLNYCKQALKVSKLNFEFVPNHLKTLDLCLDTIEDMTISYTMKSLPKDIKNDFDSIKKIVNHNVNSFQYIKETFRNDKEYCSLIVKENTQLFQYVSDELKKNEEFVFDVLNNYQKYKRANRFNAIENKSIEIITFL